MAKGAVVKIISLTDPSNVKVIGPYVNRKAAVIALKRLYPVWGVVNYRYIIRSESEAFNQSH